MNREYNTEQFRQKYKTWRNDIQEMALNSAANLPLFYLNQQTHFISPAGKYEMLEKAVSGGCTKTEDLLGRANVSMADVSSLFDIEEQVLRQIPENDPYPGLILIDGEDANDINDESVVTGRQNAINIFTKGWGSPNIMRFYRPTGLLDFDYCYDDITGVFLGVARALSDNEFNEFPIHGVTIPKPDFSEELEWVCSLLHDVEKTIGLAPNSIKLQFLAESARSIENIDKLAKTAKDRLCAIVFGKADYASELGIDSLQDSHAAIEYARIRVINAAAARGVPAIDSMTFSYPVVQKDWSDDRKKHVMLEKLRDVYDDALNAARLGMDGKWVGHPLQLFAAKAAFKKSLGSTQSWLSKLEQYSGGSGAAMIGGEMADRATDRQVRAMLRKAMVCGMLTPQDALKFNIISREEYDKWRL